MSPVWYIALLNNEYQHLFSFFEWNAIQLQMDKNFLCYKWTRHDMETFSALLAFCEGNQPMTDGFPLHSASYAGLLLMDTLLVASTSCWKNAVWSVKSDPTTVMWRHSNFSDTRRREGIHVSNFTHDSYRHWLKALPGPLNFIWVGDNEADGSPLWQIQRDSSAPIHSHQHPVEFVI